MLGIQGDQDVTEAACRRRPGLEACLEQVWIQDVSGFFPEASQARTEGNTSILAVCHLSQPSFGSFEEN